MEKLGRAECDVPRESNGAQRNKESTGIAATCDRESAA
jgi:hypothetical protein